jgi:hypothetical protein
LGDFRSWIILVPRDLVGRRSIAGRRSDVFRHPLGKFGARFGIFGKIVLVERSGELGTLTR